MNSWALNMEPAHQCIGYHVHMAGVTELVFCSYVLEFLEIKRAVVLFYFCSRHIVPEFPVQKIWKTSAIDCNIVWYAWAYLLAYETWVCIDAHFCLCVYLYLTWYLIKLDNWFFTREKYSFRWKKIEWTFLYKRMSRGE